MKTTNQKTKMPDHEILNRAIRLNKNHDTFWTDRGHEKRPKNWEQLSASVKPKKG